MRHGACTRMCIPGAGRIYTSTRPHPPTRARGCGCCLRPAWQPCRPSPDLPWPLLLLLLLLVGRTRCTHPAPGMHTSHGSTGRGGQQLKAGHEARARNTIMMPTWAI